MAFAKPFLTAIEPQPKKPKPAVVPFPKVKPLQPNAPVNTRVAQPVPQHPPDPTLAQHGFIGSPQELDQRVGQVRTSYKRVRGVEPPAGLAWDVARSKTPIDFFDKLFDPLGLTKAAARAAGIGRTVSQQTPGVEPGVKPRPEFEKAGLVDPLQSSSLQAIRRGSAQAEEANRLAMESIVPAFNLKKYLAPAGLAAKQIATALAYSPYGLYIVGKAAALDTAQLEADVLTGHPGRRRKSHMAEVGKQVVRGVLEDIRHPSERPGLLLMDLLGFTAGAAGAVARVSRAAKAGSAGEAASALLRKPPPATQTLRVAGAEGQTLEVQALLSENQFVQGLQRLNNRRRQRKLDLRRDESQPIPGGMLSSVLPARAQDMLERAADPLRGTFSFERKIGRELEAERRTNLILDLRLKREIDQAAGWAANAAPILGRVNRAVPWLRGKGVSLGEQKALFSLSIDDPNPIAAQRRFHQRMIDEGVGDPGAHRAQLVALDQAEKVLANPAKQSARFRAAYQATVRTVEEMQRVKIEELGLSPARAEQRVAALGAVLRGEDVRGDLLARAEAQQASLKAIPKTAKNAERRAAVQAEIDSLRAQAEGAAGLPRSPASIRAEIKKLEGLLQAKHADEEAKARVEPYPEAPVREKIARLERDLAVAELEGGLKRQTESSFYAPTVSKAHSRRVPGYRQPSVRVGQFGIPAPASLPELTHEFSGDAIRAGDIRIDTTHVVGEAYARTVKSATVLNDWKRLWSGATSTPRSSFDRPIRDVRSVPEELRPLVQKIVDGDVAALEADELAAADKADLIRLLYPGRKTKDGRWVLDEPVDHVRWVNERLVGAPERVPGPPSPAVKAALLINEPIKDLILFLRPAYALNLVGSAGMLLFDRGFAGIGDVTRALRSEDLYGAENTRTIDALMGSNKTRSFAPDVRGAERITAVSSTLGQWWQVLTDNMFRRASFIGYMRKAGIETEEDLTRLLTSRELKDRQKVNEIRRRANKPMVEFDNLTWFEQNALRHVIFIYPWVSRSLVWSLRSVIEHPIKTDALVHLGDLAEQDPVFRNVVSWFKRVGYAPIGWLPNGDPVTVNPTSVNTFATLSDALGAIEGGQYQSADRMLGPAAQYLMHAVSGRDEFGNSYPGNPWFDAAAEVLTGLPQVTATKRGAAKQPPEKPLNLSDRRTLISREHDALKQTVFSPGWLDGYGILISGGLTPRAASKAALAARYWRDQPTEQRLQHEQQLIEQALALQGGLLKRGVPGPVREAVKFAGRLNMAEAAFSKSHARTPTTKERVLLLIKQLETDYKLDADTADELRRRLRPLRLEPELADFRRSLLTRYADARALQDWDRDVRLVWSFRKPVLERKLQLLKQQGLVESATVSADPESLFAYGRQVAAYADGARERYTAAVKTQGADARNLAFAELRAWQDAHDKPVVVNGYTLPSPVVIDWANQTPNAQQEALRQDAELPWQYLSSFEKRLLGRPPAPTAAEGWAKFSRFEQEQKDKLPAGHKTFPPGYLNTLAKYVDRYYAQGFFKDYLVSREPLATRLMLGGDVPAKLVDPLEHSPNRDMWLKILTPAGQYARLLRNPDYKKTEIRDIWKKYVETSLLPWARANPSMKKELDLYGPDFLYKLLD